MTNQQITSITQKRSRTNRWRINPQQFRPGVLKYPGLDDAIDDYQSLLLDIEKRAARRQNRRTNKASRKTTNKE
jgi:hypothetical protein